MESQKCSACGIAAKYKCGDCNDQLFCSTECHIGVGIDDPLLQEHNAYVSVRVSELGNEWINFKGAWLNARILRAPLPNETGVLVEIDDKKEIIQRNGARRRNIPYSRVERFRDYTENHQWKIGNKVHVRRDDKYGEVWWEATIVELDPQHITMQDTCTVKWDHQYARQISSLVVKFLYLRLANMDDFEHI